MARLVWSEPDRYFQGLCGNELALETPPDEMSKYPCYACVYPFSGSIPEVPCSAILLPDPTHTYILRQAAAFSVPFSYPDVTIEPQVVNPGATYYSRPYGNSVCAFGGSGPNCYWQDLGVANSREFYSTRSAVGDPTDSYNINSYNNLWQPDSLWNSQLINSFVLERVGDYIVPMGRYFQNRVVGCYWEKSIVTSSALVSTTLEHTLPELITDWETYLPDYKIHPVAHATRCQFYDRVVSRRVIGTSAQTGLYEVYMLVEIDHTAWVAANPRSFGLPQEGNYTYSWGEETTFNNGNTNPFAVGRYFPRAKLYAKYLWSSTDIEEFHDTVNFTCELTRHPVVVAGFTTPKIEDPGGAKFSAEYAQILGPIWTQSDDSMRFVGVPGTSIRAFGRCALWAADHLVDFPDSLVISRIDVTPDS